MPTKTKTKTKTKRQPSKRGTALCGEARGLTYQQASALTGIPAYTMRELARRGQVPHMRLGRSLWFSRERLAEWFEQGMPPTAK